MKQGFYSLPALVGRSFRWFKDALNGVISRITRWVQGPPPTETRPGRSQLNLSDSELQAVTDQIGAYPSMGGKKGAANLAHAQAAWVGAGSYDAINNAFAELVGAELQERRHERPAPPPYEPPVATDLGQVWGGDLFEIKAWDIRFDICDFLDVFNQEYVALEATLHAADSVFVASCFENACTERGGKPPTVATKTDRGSQFKGVFSKALEGRGTHHERIPPGSPWFNGESERGHRDARALLMAELSKGPRPRKGHELAAVQLACVVVKRLLNEVISKPSLGNVTPKEIATGVQDEVRSATARYVERQREERRHRAIQDSPLLDRLRGMLGLKEWPVPELLRFLRLRSRDYKFIEEG